jgi:hypothetical protein
MKLTRRGKLVVALLIASAIFAVVYILNDITTPAICKVPVSHMSSFCKELLFPH